MKIVSRRVLLLLILSLVPLLLSAGSWKPQAIVLGMSNDVWSNGLSRNDDDQDTFALFSRIEGEEGWLRMDAHAITNRGWKDGWVPGNVDSPGIGDIYRGRYDDLEILIGRTFTPYASTTDTLSLKMEAGATVLGKLGMEAMQNGLHGTMGIHDLVLPYETARPIVRPNLNLDFSFKHHLMRIGNGDLSGVASAEIYAIFSLFHQETLSLSLMMTGSSGDYGYVKLGWNNATSTSGYKTMDLYSEFLSSPQFSFGFRAGAVRLDYEVFTLTDYGNTRVSFDLLGILAMGERRANGRKDIPSASIGYSYTPQVNYMVGGFELPVEGKENWYLVAIDRFTAGTPIPDYNEEEIDILTEPRKKLNDAFLTAGIKRVIPFSSTAILEPFVHGTLGLAFLRYDELRNMVESPEYPEPSYSYHAIRPCIDLGLGLQTGIIRIPHMPIPPFDFYLRGGIVLTHRITKTTPTGVDLHRSGVLPYLEIGVSVDMDF